ncbi:metal-dependent hydrolase [Exilibacterium tricleocarpae]|uniref:Metal-dependent hydrolase n=1 Tax=Exilibacterium tricleocarpae TaxID=2591008 RepID=A0A545TZ80_9GAMM|nr:metal-dependent hydrolase [Exilibacterium tricleocarpae]TQV82493.1 metal-dependent hydrolase [Exilibacterium tricleocarpae]
MDSVTQFVLGAAVGEAVLGKKIGRRALIWGGICGTLPDLDVFIPMGDPVSDFTYHRSFSHSLFVLALLTPVIVALVTRLHKQTRQYRWQWFTLIYLVFTTHVLLDSFTAYGTQILWPFFTTPVSWSTIFIIDPLYTLPLLIGMIAALVIKRKNGLGHRINQLGLLLSGFYLSWTVGAKLVVNDAVEQTLRQNSIAHQSFFTTPAPFTSLLWRVVVMDERGYYEGFYSIFDGDQPIRFSHYRSQNDLLVGIENTWAVKRLQWFSKGFFAVKQQQQDLIVSDLRMGLEPTYVFQFKVGELSNPHAIATPPTQVETPLNLSLLSLLWQRIWDATVEIDNTPPAG